jgi:hypothetical protein
VNAIHIIGELDTDAQHRVGSGGINLLMLQVRPPCPAGGKPLLLRVAKSYGSGNAAAYTAKNRAHHLKRGVRVEVSAAAWQRCRGGMELLGVDHVAAPDLDSRAVGGDRE